MGKEVSWSAVSTEGKWHGEITGRGAIGSFVH